MTQIRSFKSKILKKSGPTLEKCPNCEISGKMKIHVICEVSYWNFIPSWASQKKAILVCELCMAKFKLNFESQLYQNGQELLLKSRYRLWFFSGPILFITFFIGMISIIYMGIREDNEKIQKEFENLNSGNVIFYKLENGEETSMLVEKVESEKVYVRENKYSTNKDAYNLNLDGNYSGQINEYSKQSLRKMLEEKIIYNIY